MRAGSSRVLVLRGAPGIGKSALLEYAAHSATDLQVLRMAVDESEQGLGFAGVHQLLLPLLDRMDRLPTPQRRALGVAFGLVSEPPADPFLVGLAVLTLVSDAAQDMPVLCVVDDAQWLDKESADTLGFVARRLLADRVGMLFGVRETTGPVRHLQALPGLHVAGLSPEDAHELLGTSISRPIETGVAERIVAETGGNPLAVVEATHALTPEQLGGRAPVPDPLPVGHRLEVLFAQRVRELPADTQALLLLAAADHTSREATLWQAAAALAIPESAALPVEATRLVALMPEVRFSHPLVRSAIYHAATPSQRRRTHRALAEACDPVLDADARAWHLAAAAAGPDERAAAEQEAAADRAAHRGGHTAAAGLLERAALLTPDPERRAERLLAAAETYLLAGVVDRARALLAEATPDLHDPRSDAQATRLEGRIQFARGQVGEAASTMVDAAKRLGPLDPRAARDTLLSALDATVFAGWASNTTLLQEIARTARNLPPTG
ncbi:MAG: AAA family ATPase, partial [Thermoleophilaceae bacterium]